MINTQKATFAGGCFWCTEAIFQRLEGVLKVTPGYTGGEVDNPDYEKVSTGSTGHAESINIEFDPEKITYEDLLYVFFATHDPTTSNRQGADIGTQYRSEIFYHSEEQKKKAEQAIKDTEEKLGKSVVTKISKFDKFFEAESYHKNYFNNNPSAMYCKVVIEPKIKKLMMVKKELNLV